MTGDRRAYEDRRPYVTPESLDDLRGPSHGRLDLPASVAWTGRRSYDLDVAEDRRVMYERVVVEAANVADLSALLNGTVLQSLWPQLYLPVRVRALWQARFPGLAVAA